MAAERNKPLRARVIERAVALQTGIEIMVEQEDGVVVVTGMVESDEMRGAVLDVVRSLAANRRIDDNLDVIDYLPDQVGETAAEPLIDVSDEVRSDDVALREIEPDFTDQPILTDPVAASGPTASEEDLVGDGDDVYVPPTDPVIGLDERNNVVVIGGFSPDSMTSISVARSALDDQPGDEALADAVRRELREDATTTDLGINVSVRNGVVYLRGEVAGLEDVENAEAVAGNVPGVRDVVDDVKVVGL